MTTMLRSLNPPEGGHVIKYKRAAAAEQLAQLRPSGLLRPCCAHAGQRRCWTDAGSGARHGRSGWQRPHRL